MLPFLVHMSVSLCWSVNVRGDVTMHRLARLDAWTRIFRVWMPSRARFPERPWRATWQRKAIRQASKDTQRLPASPPLHHHHHHHQRLFGIIHTSHRWDGGTQVGRREWVHLQAVPLRDCTIAYIWMVCQWPGGFFPQTAPSPCLHPSDFPHQLLPGASSLTVCHLCPAETQAGVISLSLSLWVISLLEPLWSESMHPAWPRGGMPLGAGDPLSSY